MLTVRSIRRAPVVLLAAITWLGVGAPAAAAGPLDPADPCVDAASVACQQYRRQVDPPPRADAADRWCGPHRGVHVPCSAGPAGFWVADPPVVYGFPTTAGYPASRLSGCWARSLGAPTPRPRPDWTYPLRGPHTDRGGPGLWFTLSCLGKQGVWPDDLATGVAVVWLQAADLPRTDTDLLLDTAAGGGAASAGAAATAAVGGVDRQAR